MFWYKGMDILDGIEKEQYLFPTKNLCIVVPHLYHLYWNIVQKIHLFVLFGTNLYYIWCKSIITKKMFDETVLYAWDEFSEQHNY